MTTVSTIEPRTWDIPTGNFARFEAKFARLARKAANLGCEVPTFTVVGTYDQPELDEAGLATGRVVTYKQVQVFGQAPTYEGWKMSAVIDRTTPGDLNLVHALDAEIDPAWYTLPERCDHCHVAGRGRKLLVVVDHEDGDRKIVGTTCLKDFLGHVGPENVAAAATWVADLSNLDEEFSDLAPTYEFGYSLPGFMAWVAKAIREEGWVPKSRAGYGVSATADVALMLQDDARNAGPAHPDAWPTDADQANADAAIAWARTLEIGGNDYINNVVAVVGCDVLSKRHVGIAASIIPAWEREMGRLAEREARTKAGAASHHFGAPGERLEVAGTVTMTRYFDSDFGTRALVKIVTDGGDLVTWWASNANKAPVKGDRVVGKATVKKHEVYEGQKSTVITRPAFTIKESA